MKNEKQEFSSKLENYENYNKELIAENTALKICFEKMIEMKKLDDGKCEWSEVDSEEEQDSIVGSLNDIESYVSE